MHLGQFVALHLDEDMCKTMLQSIRSKTLLILCHVVPSRRGEHILEKYTKHE